MPYVAPLITIKQASYNFTYVAKVYNIGDKVFDMASQSVQTVLDRHIGIGISKDADGETDFDITFHYETSAPPDPTGDGAFTSGWRNAFEVCDPDKTLELDY